MFTDWAEALEAESLPLDPTSAQQLAAAARLTARSSHDKHDMTLLLDALGLPTDPDTLTAHNNLAYAYQWWLTMVLGFALVWFGIRRELRAEDPQRFPARPKKTRIWDEEDE